MEAVKIFIVSIEISYILVMGRELGLENVLLASSNLAGKYVSIKLDPGVHTLIKAKFRVWPQKYNIYSTTTAHREKKAFQ